MPRRLAGGHRRYDEADVALVTEVLRQRATGVSVAVAVERAGQDAHPAYESMFAGLRRRHPDLVPLVLGKRTLTALSRAVEDESCARAERPALWVSFQRAEFYQQSRRRWADLSRTAESAVAFAAFSRPRLTGRLPLEVPVPRDSPLSREWAVVCDAPDYPACLVGWEHPGQEGRRDEERQFETLLTVEPDAVRDAAIIAGDLARRFLPAIADLLPPSPPARPAPASEDLRRVTGLFHRMIAYVDGQAW